MSQRTMMKNEGIQKPRSLNGFLHQEKHRGSKKYFDEPDEFLRTKNFASKQRCQAVFNITAEERRSNKREEVLGYSFSE